MGVATETADRRCERKERNVRLGKTNWNIKGYANSGDANSGDMRLFAATKWRESYAHFLAITNCWIGLEL